MKRAGRLMILFIIPLIDATRSFSQALVQARGVRQPPSAEASAQLAQDLHRLNREDGYRLKVGGIKVLRREGVSLADIEKMPMPLSLGDIKRINRMYRHNLLLRSDAQTAYIAQAGFIFAVQPSARVDLNLAIPRQIRPLYDRLTNYWDYYTNLMINPAADYEEEFRLGKIICWLGMGFVRNLACYMPARLDITPASTMKLFEMHQIFAGRDLTWRVMGGRIGQEVARAYRADNLPVDLQPYQHYNQDADKRASQMLSSFYRNELQREPSAQNSASYLDTQAHLARLNLYWQAVRGDILSSGQGYLSFKLTGHPISEVRLTCQNRKVLMFILLMADSQTHLTIEVDKNGQLFGIPVDLTYEIPQITNLLMRDILDPVLAWACAQHSQLKLKPAAADGVWAKKQVTTPIQAVIGGLDMDEPKPKVRRRFYRLPLFEEPDLPQPVTAMNKRLTLIHQRSQVVDLLGVKKAAPNVVDQIMRDINLCEYGRKRLEPLEQLPGCYKFRSGDYRVIVQPQDDGVYSLVKIGYRGNVYDFN